MKLNEKAFGLTVGTFAGIWWLLAMGFSLMTGIGVRTISILGGFHPGFAYSWDGLIWMVVMHLICGFILGWLFAEVYNRYSK